MSATVASQLARQPAKPSARLRLTKKLVPFRTFCMNSTRITTISRHAFHPAGSLELRM